VVRMDTHSQRARQSRAKLGLLFVPLYYLFYSFATDLNEIFRELSGGVWNNNLLPRSLS